MVCTAQVMVVDGLAFPTGTRGMGNLSLTGNKQQSQHKKTRKITAPIAWDTEGLYENPTPYSAHTEKSKMPVCQQHIQHQAHAFRVMRILGKAMSSQPRASLQQRASSHLQGLQDQEKNGE